MTSCPPIPHQRSHRFRSAVVAAGVLAHLVLVDHRDPPGPRVIQVLPDQRVMLANADLPDQKALEGFRVHLDLLAVELEGPLFLVPKDREALLALLDRREIREFRVLLDQREITVFPALLVPPGQMVNQALRVRMARPVLLDLLVPRVLPDLLESVALPVRMR